MPMEVLLGKPPQHAPRRAARRARAAAPLDLDGVALEQVAFDVLRHPTVASKRFLITIGDRTVGGLSHRDQMVGPWQVPVADCAVTLADYAGFRGEAMSMGERTPLAALDAPASGRMAVGEAHHQPARRADRAGARQAQLQLDGRLRRAGRGRGAVRHRAAVGMELCPALGISVPVGKDILSMRTRWSEGGAAKQVTAPVSLIVTAFATLDDVRGTLTPQLQPGDTTLILIDLGQGRTRMGGSMLAQVLGQFGDEVPDLDDPALLKALVAAINRAARRRAGCSPTTTAATAACGRRCARWPSPATCGVSLNVDLLVTEGDGITDSRAEYGDSKNWASAGRRAAQRADAARAVQRGARRRAAGAAPPSATR